MKVATVLVLVVGLAQPAAAQQLTIEYLHSADPPGLALSRWSQGQASAPLWMQFGPASLLFVRHEQMASEAQPTLVAYRLQRTASGGTQGFRSRAPLSQPLQPTISPPAGWGVLMHFQTLPSQQESALWQAPAGSRARAREQLATHLAAQGWQARPRTSDSVQYQRQQQALTASLLDARLSVWQVDLIKPSKAPQGKRSP